MEAALWSEITQRVRVFDFPSVGFSMQQLISIELNT
jgi:hypothetical protein